MLSCPDARATTSRLNQLVASDAACGISGIRGSWIAAGRGGCSAGRAGCSFGRVEEPAGSWGRACDSGDWT
ncbi:hypothetical protein [Streptosporangium vulgare]|uniref:hypothetical protein n=1 Tax=Streptosporangium vulgare TaxID=46190 RepID=UPI0031DD7288